MDRIKEVRLRIESYRSGLERTIEELLLEIQMAEERRLELEKMIEGQFDGSAWGLTQTKPDVDLISDMREVLSECEKHSAFLKGKLQGLMAPEKFHLMLWDFCQ